MANFKQALLCLLSFSLAAFSCLQNQSWAKPPTNVILAAEQKLTYNLDHFPETLDPGLAGDFVSQVALNPLFDGLYRYNAKGEFVPAAAASYSVSDNGMLWTFYLRPEAKWHDGKPVTAHDFVYAWQRLGSPNSMSIYADFLVTMHLVNGQEVLQGILPPEMLGVTAVDDYTLQVRLEKPVPWLLQLVSNPQLYPVREDIILKHGNAWTIPENIIGNGPFKLTSYLPNDQITYHKWDGYWDAENITLTDLKATFLEENIAYYSYLKGDLPITKVYPAIKKRVLSERPTEVYMTPLNATYYINLNQQLAKFKDQRVRKALALLIDNRFIAKHIVAAGQATTSIVPENIEDAELMHQASYFRQVASANYDQARNLLVEAGYSVEKPLTFNFAYSDSRVERALFITIQQMWQKNSEGLIAITGEQLEWKTFLHKVRGMSYEASINGWAADYNQATTFLDLRRCGAGSNYSGYCDSQYDNLLEMANNLIDKETRQKLYAQANEKLQEEFAILPLYWMTAIYLKSPVLGGFNPYREFNDVRDLYIIAGSKVRE